METQPQVVTANGLDVEHLDYQSGFGNEFASEAVPDALPEGQNNPQQPPLGLYTEQLSGTAFTVPNARNRRTWFYRIRPSVRHAWNFAETDNHFIRTGPNREAKPPIGQLRWDPPPFPDGGANFITGLRTMATNGDAHLQVGMAAHVYMATESMTRHLLLRRRRRAADRAAGGTAAPGHGVRRARGGARRDRGRSPGDDVQGRSGRRRGPRLRLRELRPLSRAARTRADRRQRTGQPARLPRSRGRLRGPRPERRAVRQIRRPAVRGARPTTHRSTSSAGTATTCPTSTTCAGSTSSDRSASTTPIRRSSPCSPSPSPDEGVANIDFVVFADRWLVAEHTFRPPWYHRNVMSEFMGILYGVYDAKEEGFRPGGMSLHNMYFPHGPDNDAWTKATNSDLQPQKLADTMSFMFETRYPLVPTAYAGSIPALQDDYPSVWHSLDRHFNGTGG